MALRRNPTARQIRLGAELRKLRECAGFTTNEAARVLNVDQGKMSHFEAGRSGVGEGRVRKLAASYGVSDAALVDALAAMANERRRGWWDSYRGILPDGFLDLAELEHHASFMRLIEITQIPGLLQTEAHALAVFENVVSELPRDDLAARVEFRMRRRDLLRSDRAPEFEAVIHEAALRIRVADRKVARAQLKTLVGESERDGITIRVIPFDVDRFASAGYSMMYAGGPVPQLDTVQLDNVHSGVFLDEEPQLAKHRDLYQKSSSYALGAVESRDYMHSVMKEM